MYICIVFIRIIFNLKKSKYDVDINTNKKKTRENKNRVFGWVITPKNLSYSFMKNKSNKLCLPRMFRSH